MNTNPELAVGVAEKPVPEGVRVPDPPHGSQVQRSPLSGVQRIPWQVGVLSMVPDGKDAVRVVKTGVAHPAMRRIVEIIPAVRGEIRWESAILELYTRTLC